MTLPQRKKRFPAWFGGRSFSSAERLLFALWLSLLLHGALLMLPVLQGSLRGAPAGETMRLTMREQAVRGGDAKEKAVDVPPQPSVERPVPQVPGDGESQAEAASRLGLEVYYPVSELDRPAEPLEQITLPDWQSAEAGEGALLLVYIDENGVVDRVKTLDSRPPELAERVRSAFENARFAPALKDGRAVKSFKRVQIAPQPLPYEGRELSR